MLCAATAGLLSAQGRPEPPEKTRFASWDEVNVLAHGLLQLGNGLREHVERTRGQLGELERRLGSCGAACKDPEGSAAPPFAPENLVPPGGDAVPETLRSFQVRTLLLPWKGVDGRGRISDSLGSPARASKDGELGVGPGMNGEVGGGRPDPHQGFILSPDSAQGSEQQDPATLPEGGPAAAAPGEAAPENPESAEPGAQCLPQVGREVEVGPMGLDVELSRSSSLSQPDLTPSSCPVPDGPLGPHAPGPRGGQACQEEEATQDGPACWPSSKYQPPAQ